MDWNAALLVFTIVNKWGAILTNWPNCLSSTKINNTLDVADNCYWIDYNAVKQLQHILIFVQFHHLYLEKHLFLYFVIIPLFQKIIILIYNLFLC